MLAISQRHSVEEYLELEETAEFRSEYHDGEIIPMAGESPEHNEISINLILELKPQLPEEVRLYAANIKLWIPQYKRYVYPDLMLANLPQWMALERGGKALTNPCLIIEVLSESTRNYDQGDKFSFYRSIPELQDYLMVDQYQQKILYYCKSEGGWFLREFDRPDSTIELSNLGLTVRLVAVYKNVEI